MHRREDLYAGPELDKIPDLVVEFRDYAWLGKGNLTERTPALEDADLDPRAPRPALRGRPPARRDLRPRRARRAGRRRSWQEPGSPTSRPTVMYLLGEAVPAAFEGRLLAEAIEPSLLDERPPEFDDDEEAAAGRRGAREPARGRGAAT